MNFKLQRRFNLAACVIAISSLAACGAVPGVSDFGAMKTGTQVTAEQMDQIKDNQTKQDEVIALLGQPNRKAQAGNKTIWSYDFNQIGQALIGRNINETTAVEFNSKGIVTAHYKTGGQQGSSSNALLRAAGQ